MNLAQLLFDQAERYRAVRALRVPQPKLARDIAGEHKRLFEATIARRTNRAIKALEDHYRTTAEHVVASLRHLPRVRN